MSEKQIDRIEKKLDKVLECLEHKDLSNIKIDSNKIAKCLNESRTK